MEVNDASNMYYDDRSIDGVSGVAVERWRRSHCAIRRLVCKVKHWRKRCCRSRSVKAVQSEIKN